MEQTGFSAVFDRMFLLFTVFALTFFFALSYAKSLVFAIFSAISATVAAFCIIKLTKRDEKRKENKLQKLRRQSLALRLTRSSDGGVGLISELLGKKYSVRPAEGGVFCRNLEDKKVFVLPDFSPAPADERTVLTAFRTALSLGADSAVLLCRSCDKKAKQFAVALAPPRTAVLEEKAVFDLFEKYGFDFSLTDDTVKKEKLPALGRLTSICDALFTKERAKGFALCGITLLVCGLFARLFTLYYGIFGAVLLILSVVCRFRNNEKQKTSDENEL